jgi:hypothetical protein
MTTPNLDSWLYASQCTLPTAWAPKAVGDIVEKSIPRNAALAVTGALLFTGARFVQFLEGPAAGIAEIRDSILADTRHQGITTLPSGARAARIFSGWSLAYAGPSVFVSDKVESLFRDGIGDAAEMIHLLEQFVTSGHGAQ